MMTQANAILGLIAQTSIHAGAGTSAGVVDLPIQREGHNGWPCVFGSAVKGALRARAEDIRHKDVVAVFGPDTNNASADHAGAICVGDARLLLLPVRSLTSTFKWVTCNEALKRYQRDAELLNMQKAPQFTSLDVIDEKETLQAQVHQVHPQGSLFLEEYRFTASHVNLTDIITALATLMYRDDAKDELEKRLVIISDNMFSFLARQATQVAAHIAIDNTTKTVRKGCLWYEETLPPETLLYVPLMASCGRDKAKSLTANDVRQVVVEDSFKKDDGQPHPWLQIGGNETVGMGWCGVKAILAEG
jgi:CRISPR-associated protein Cmr4